MKDLKNIVLVLCMLLWLPVSGLSQGRFVRLETEADSLRIKAVADSLRADSLHRAAVKDSLMKAREPVLRAMRNKVEGSYNFWIYTPAGYDSKDTLCKDTPLVLFLHGKSLCGHDLEKVRRYGSIDCMERGRHIQALVVAPQNPGEWWNPDKLCKILDWLKVEYPYDTARVYVLGMSLGGYGTLDFTGSYPEKVAAAMALCGGCTLKDMQGLGKVPLWILHGTADKAVGIGESKRVVSALQAAGNDQRLRYDWLQGASHGALARAFYMFRTYDWLFRHSLKDQGRPLCKDFTITNIDLKSAYQDMNKDLPAPEVIDD